MSIVFKIGITEKNNKEIERKEKIEVVASKGIIGDRYFHDFNVDRKQITLIESENIDYYNKTFNTNFNYLDFRRNIVTKDIELNNLVGKTIFVGEIKLQVTDLCRPCKYLQDRLKQNNIIKEFLRRGGLRCKILTSGIINIGDKIIVKS
jgi:MOSC domain-containing protein YiiM|tara:strand:+ start:4403 stop:4849 length:447 start_codon:yes stop_codon:yes gene_type:complete